MDFSTATEKLCSCPEHGDIAAELGVSVQLIRQARLSGDKSGYRGPPDGWEKVVAKLARQKATELDELADELDGPRGEPAIRLL